MNKPCYITKILTVGVAAIVACGLIESAVAKTDYRVTITFYNYTNLSKDIKKIDDSCMHSVNPSKITLAAKPEDKERSETVFTADIDSSISNGCAFKASTVKLEVSGGDHVYLKDHNGEINKCTFAGRDMRVNGNNCTVEFK